MIALITGGSTLTTTDVGRVSLLGSQNAFSISALSDSLKLPHAPNTSSCQLATASLPVTDAAAAADEEDDDVSFDA